MTSPCRYCKKAYVTKSGRRKRCFEGCEDRTEYEKHLDKSRKYEPGEVITSLGELLKQKLVFWNDHVSHMGFIQSMSVRTVDNDLKLGRFRYAIKRTKGEENGDGSIDTESVQHSIDN